MRGCLAVAALSALGSQTHANDIFGTWNCAERTAKYHSVSQVGFSKSGQMRATVAFQYFENGQAVARSRANYRAKYELVGDKFIDRPTFAKVTEFVLRGKDVRSGPHAEELKRSLLSSGNGIVLIKFSNPDAFKLVRENGSTIGCQREKASRSSS